MGGGDAFDDYGRPVQGTRSPPTSSSSPVAFPTSSYSAACPGPTSACRPNPKNPLNDDSTMNKVVEYVAMVVACSSSRVIARHRDHCDRRRVPRRILRSRHRGWPGPDVGVEINGRAERRTAPPYATRYPRWNHEVWRVGPCITVVFVWPTLRLRCECACACRTLCFSE